MSERQRATREPRQYSWEEGDQERTLCWPYARRQPPPQPLYDEPLPTPAHGLAVSRPGPPYLNRYSTDSTTTRLDSLTAAAVAASQPPSRPPNRICKTDGCGNYIVHKGLCYRHGGGKRCSVDGCSKSAKHQGLCYRHGGSVECKIAECASRAKVRGLCWTHGRGSQCTQDGCVKVAVSNGRCWAHGGGKRCIHDGCQRPGIKRTHDFCAQHFQELKDIDYYEV